MAYKDKPLKLGRVVSLKITHLKYYGNRMSLTYSSRPMIPPPPLKRLFKAVGLRSAKTRCGAPYALKLEDFGEGGSKSPKMIKKMVIFDVCDKTSVR